ncbi:hypothetical protein [Gimesia panareensis]|uniref:Uncharacterized protein n=1 Tax=Gimesia panareensis TaxID=2527978 RepID=A0A518A7H5_9PLAN|nr:hypothetical protein [Gimesia panareensis]QDT26444.1 hypothetical protein Enr10x_17480 [Gimesia panareensis]QDU50678.1 hypothetical protein Pan110_30310 [Gimesia panareensis]
MEDRDLLEEKLCQLIYDNLLILKTIREVQQAKLAKIEQTMIKVLEAHQPEQLVAKETASILYVYPYALEAEVPYCDQPDVLVSHCRTMEKYFGMLLARQLPEDRQFGRIL